MKIEKQEKILQRKQKRIKRNNRIHKNLTKGDKDYYTALQYRRCRIDVLIEKFAIYKANRSVKLALTGITKEPLFLNIPILNPQFTDNFINTWFLETHTHQIYSKLQQLFPKSNIYNSEYYEHGFICVIYPEPDSREIALRRILSYMSQLLIEITEDINYATSNQYAQLNRS
jgi:hypothetical protein